MLHPIVIGSGKRLFEPGIDRKVLRLVRTQPLDSGIVVLYYEPTKQGEAGATAAE